MSDGEEKYDAQGEEKKPFFSTFSGSYSDPAEKFGSQIGLYRLVSILGEGGYGIVYLAEQQKTHQAKSSPENNQTWYGHKRSYCSF